MMAPVERLKRFVISLLNPIPVLLVWQWVEANCYLSERASALPGRVSTLLTPYVREPLQCFADKRITDLTLCWGAQTVKTTVIMCGTAYRLVNDPTPTLWVMPNKDLAGDFSENRWLPFVEDCPPLKAQKPSSAKRHLWKKTSQFFAKVTLTLVGSNSPANLASRPAGQLNLDEVDKFKLSDDREAGALQLAEERTKSFPFPLRVKTSTPTTVYGEIWKQFLAGDQRYLFMPCPHCGLEDGGNWIRFEFKQLRWWYTSEDEAKTNGEWDMDKVRRLAHYRCPNCDGIITDGHKTAMVRRGAEAPEGLGWRPMNPNAPRYRRSYHLNSFYAPWKECLFGNIAVKWLETRGNMAARQNFVNSTLAEVWDDEKAVDDVPLKTENYSVSKIQLVNERIALLHADVQEDHFWAVARLWSATIESWLLWAGRLETIEELQSLQRKYGVAPRRVTMDMADRPNRVASWLVKNDWRGLVGSDRQSFTHMTPDGKKIQRLYSPPETRDPNLGTVHQDERNQRAIFAKFSKDGISELLDSLRFMDPVKWHLHPDIPECYQKHLNAEIKTHRLNPRTRRVEWFYKQIRREDHLRDCEKGQIVNAMLSGVIQDASEIVYARPTLPDGLN